MAGTLFTKFPRRVIAFACLLAMSSSASGVLPAFAFLLGQLDSDHEAVVSTSHGHLEIRFHHLDDAPRDHLAAGENGIEMRALESHDDHVIQFGSIEHVRLQLPAPVLPDHRSVAVAVIAAESLAPVARDFAAVPHARPPPNEASLIRCLRSIVLLV